MEIRNVKDFRFLVKVNPDNPKGATEALGGLLEGNREAFDVDLDFLKQQDFITAVPIEIALTIPMRSQIMYCNPECNFIITGVPTSRVAKLLRYGYTVLPTCEVKAEEPTVKKDNIAHDRQDSNTVTSSFWYNGNRVKQEEFEEKFKEFEKVIDEFKERCPDYLRKYLN